MKYLFSLKYNLFDVICILIITWVSSAFSLWLCLLMIPLVVISALGEIKYDEKNGKQSFSA